MLHKRAILTALLLSAGAHAEAQTQAAPSRGGQQMRQTPGAPSNPMAVMRGTRGGVQMDAATLRQLQNLRWNRPGTWMPVAVDAPGRPMQVALYAKDTYGERILWSPGTAGYEVYPVALNCDLKGMSVQKGSHFDDDAGKVGKPGAVATFRLSSGEATRLCSASRDKAKGYAGTPTSAVQIMREARATMTPQGAPTGRNAKDAALRNPGTPPKRPAK